MALGEAGKVLVKKKFTQEQLLTYTANLQTSLMGLEACSELSSSGVPYASRATMSGSLQRSSSSPS